MKSAFILVSLALVTGFAAAIAADVLGLVSLPGFSIPVFVSAFTATGVAGIAFQDYSRPRVPRVHRIPRPARRRERGAESAMATWGCQTYTG